MAIGYACLTIGVPNTIISRCNLKNADSDTIRRLIKSNLSALEAIIDYNIKNDIKLFRISSDIIPFGSHPINQVIWWEEFQDVLLGLGQKINKAGIRVSMHPGQYTVLNSNSADVVQNARKELEYHAGFLDSLGMDETSKLVLHIGGVYGDKAEAISRFVYHVKRLPAEVKSRLIIENDDKNYNIDDVLKISEQIGTPVVFDNLHHKLNAPNEEIPDFVWINRCKKTWSSQDGRQKIHYSQQQENKAQGSHSDTISLEAFMKYYDELSDLDLDIMLEVKDKNLSAVKCRNAVNQVTAKELEKEWARYQYFVLSRSASLYQELQELLKDKKSQAAMSFYDIVEKASLLVEDNDAQISAAQHVWGYISKDCTKAERNRYEKLLEAYSNANASPWPLKNHILKCAEKRDLNYLIQSLYFYL